MIDQIREELGFNAWVVQVAYHRGTGPAGDDGGTVAMEISHSWEYRELSIDVYCGTIEGIDNDRLEMVIWHEFMHPMVAKLRPRNRSEQMRLLEESVCTDLAYAFYFTNKARRQRWADERKLEEKRLIKEAKRQSKTAAEPSAA